MSLSLLSESALSRLREFASGSPAGCLVEVGVYKGGSAMELAIVAREQGRHLYLYDTFTGIPYRNTEKGDSHVVGDFSDTDVAAVRKAIPDAFVIQGLFPETIVDTGPSSVAFAHIDADQYQSIIESTRALWPIMATGGIIVYDDYSCLEGATNAVQELFGRDVLRTPEGKAYVIKGHHDLAS